MGISYLRNFIIPLVDGKISKKRGQHENAMGMSSEHHRPETLSRFYRPVQVISKLRKYEIPFFLRNFVLAVLPYRVSVPLEKTNNLSINSSLIIT